MWYCLGDVNKDLLTPERGPAADKRRPPNPNVVNPCIYLSYLKGYVGGVTCERVEKGYLHDYEEELLTKTGTTLRHLYYSKPSLA